MPAALQDMATGILMSDYRDLLLALGADRSNVVLSKRCDAYEEEALRRMAW